MRCSRRVSGFFAIVAAVAAPLVTASVAVAREDESKALKRISGMVWLDQNANGLIDAGEPGIAGHEMVLVGPGGTQSRLSGANGRYSFDDLPDGIYHLRSTDRSAFGQTWTIQGKDSRPRQGSGELTSPVELSDQADPSELSFDSGFVTVVTEVPTSPSTPVSAPPAVDTGTAAPTTAPTTAPAPTTTTTAVPAAVQQSRPLADTGASVGLLALGGTLLAGGGAAVWGVRRRT